MTWTQSLEAFAINKKRLSDILKVPFDFKSNQRYWGKCMACLKMEHVKKTHGVQLCKDCWDLNFKGENK
jgi:hypothetical protein